MEPRAAPVAKAAAAATTGVDGATAAGAEPLTLTLTLTVTLTLTLTRMLKPRAERSDVIAPSEPCLLRCTTWKRA